MASKPEPWAASVVVATAGVGLAVRPDLRLPICLLLIAVLLSPPGVASIVDVHATFMGATLERPRVHELQHKEGIVGGNHGDSIEEDAHLYLGNGRT